MLQMGKKWNGEALYYFIFGVKTGTDAGNPIFSDSFGLQTPFKL